MNFPHFRNGFPSFFLAMGLARGAGGESLVAPGSVLEKLAGDFKFTEGPAADAQSNVYFVDVANCRIHVWTIEGKLTTFREQTLGANGMVFGTDGALYACEGLGRRVVRFTLDGDCETVVDHYEGKRLNSPNDLWIDPRGGIYFTDPRYGKRRDDMEIDGFHVYYVAPDGGKTLRVIDSLVKPNGVKGTADGKTLYVADHGDHKTYAYDIQPDGTLANGHVLIERGADGLTLDEHGNVYLTPQAPAPVREGMDPPGTSISIYTPDGEFLEAIEAPEKPANVTFGGPGNQTLFITARTSLYAIRMSVKGQ